MIDDFMDVMSVVCLCGQFNDVSPPSRVVKYFRYKWAMEDKKASEERMAKIWSTDPRLRKVFKDPRKIIAGA